MRWRKEKVTKEVKQILEEIKISRKKKIKDRKAKGLCIAYI